MIGKRPKGYRKSWRPCSCHPGEAPIPCARRYALADCQAAALGNTDVVTRRAKPEGAAQGPTGDEMNPIPSPTSLPRRAEKL